MPLSMGRGRGAPPSPSGQRSLSANYCKGPHAELVPPTKALANRNSMCSERGVNLPAPGKHMVHFLLTIRSLLRLGIIVQSNKWWHLSKVAFSWDSRAGHLSASSLVCGRGRFSAFEEADNCWGRGGGVQGEHVLLLAMSAAKATEKTGLRARPLLPPLITTTYKDEKEKQREKEGWSHPEKILADSDLGERSAFFSSNTV